METWPTANTEYESLLAGPQHAAEQLSRILVCDFEKASGQADFGGSGDYRMWFSEDEQRVVIEPFDLFPGSPP